MITLVILGLMALTGAGVAWVVNEDTDNEKIHYHEPYPDQRQPRVDITKQRDYDEGARTLTETVTTTRVFPNIEPYDIHEEGL